jgi:hypothetical protein
MTDFMTSQTCECSGYREKLNSFSGVANCKPQERLLASREKPARLESALVRLAGH